MRPLAVGYRWFADPLRGHPSSMPPNPLSPMLATPGPLPSGPAWVWEWKWDATARVHRNSRTIAAQLARGWSINP